MENVFLKKIKIIAVCNWPLGGIRTFMQYIYSQFPADEFEITLLANDSREREYIEQAFIPKGIKIIWATKLFGKSLLAPSLVFQLFRQKYDIIHSQGFISAFQVALVNWLFRIPHILTIHGILESRYFEGKAGWLKRIIFKNAMKNIAVFHGVGQGIVDHLRTEFPELKEYKAKWIVIPNGILSDSFVHNSPEAKTELVRYCKIENNVFIFGFFGRFMAQKGFNYIIDAVNILNNNSQPEDFIVLAFGSGDFEREYKNDVIKNNLEHLIRFFPFNPNVAELIKGCDTILMPSIWEAWGLLASETLCSGVPLIATDCIGLKESTDDTPTIRIPSHNAAELAKAMEKAMTDNELRGKFEKFKYQAAERYDVKNAAIKLMDIFRGLSK